LSQTTVGLGKKGTSGLTKWEFTLPTDTGSAYLLANAFTGATPQKEITMLYSFQPLGFINNVGPMGMILIAVVVLVLFGRGKISSMMGEVGKGISSFKKGVDEGKKELEDSMAEARDVTPEDEKDKA